MGLMGAARAIDGNHGDGGLSPHSRGYDCVGAGFGSLDCLGYQPIEHWVSNRCSLASGKLSFVWAHLWTMVKQGLE
jgi:hypothetical protein